LEEEEEEEEEDAVWRPGVTSEENDPQSARSEVGYPSEGTRQTVCCETE
jgi:hypothetical protein